MKGANSLCFTCDNPSSVWMDEDHLRSADYCFECFAAQSTWEEARYHYFNKPDMHKLITLKLLAGRMNAFNRSIIEWEKRYGEPYELKTLGNVDRKEEHKNPNWHPELHEICHLVSGDAQ